MTDILNIKNDPIFDDCIVMFKTHMYNPFANTTFEYKRDKNTHTVHVSLSEINKLSMLRVLESGHYLSMSFRSWDLYEHPLLHDQTFIHQKRLLNSKSHVIFALQTSRNNNILQNASVFDACNLSNVKLYLNSDFYPYNDLNLDFDFTVIDCSRQNESIKSVTDVRIEFDCKANVPANTTAYCLIIHDRVVQYNPLTNVVRKII
ncbi:hypothetical protein ALC53_05052 [Atta colombica]|uniref:Double jelly roll-like domain-containing protein n=1 Tax=Atta colombica TaxID=520822 RepID=A0A151I4D7_9HYME|nr:hypothetical protein ALC53_05052 [Atta colombica]